MSVIDIEINRTTRLNILLSMNRTVLGTGLGTWPVSVRLSSVNKLFRIVPD